MNTATFVPTGDLPPVIPCYPIPVPPPAIPCFPVPVPPRPARPTGPTDAATR